MLAKQKSDVASFYEEFAIMRREDDLMILLSILDSLKHIPFSLTVNPSDTEKALNDKSSTKGAAESIFQINEDVSASQKTNRRAWGAPKITTPEKDKTNKKKTPRRMVSIENEKEDDV